MLLKFLILISFYLFQRKVIKIFAKDHKKHTKERKNNNQEGLPLQQTFEKNRTFKRYQQKIRGVIFSMRRLYLLCAYKNQ